MWPVWKGGHSPACSPDLRRLARRAEGETAVGEEVCRLSERVRGLPLEDLDTKATNPNSEAMVRRGTRVSSWDGTLDKTLPSTHVEDSETKINSRNPQNRRLIFSSAQATDLRFLLSRDFSCAPVLPL